MAHNPADNLPIPGPGRPKGSKNKATLIREALQERYPEGGEKAFWRAVIDSAAAGEVSAMRIIANRLEPELKSMDVTADLTHDDRRRNFTDTELRERLVALIVRDGQGSIGGVGVAGNLGAVAGSADVGDGE